jgi:hypothetical protein
MSGSGTTLVAARLRGHEAIGFDTDPLAVLIAGTWVADLNVEELEKKGAQILDRARERESKLVGNIAFPDGADEETRDFLSYWFDEGNRRQLKALAASISLKMRAFRWQGTSPIVARIGASKSRPIVLSTTF